jgi:hypothetical protein
MNWLSLAIKVIPAILSIIQWLISRANDKKLIAEGERRAILANAMIIASKVSIAKKIEEEAKADHIANPDSDNGFDAEFMRK